MKKKTRTSIQRKIIKAEDIITKDYKKRYSAQQVADLLNMDVEELKAQFYKRYRISIRDYQTEARIMTGRMLVGLTERSIRSIAVEVGYSSSSSFTQQFKKAYGMAPGKLRKKLKEDQKARAAGKRRYLNYN